MIKHLETVDEVIDALGGIKAVSDLMQCKASSTVPMWKHRQRFPATTFATLQAELRKRGASAPTDLWGMKTPECAA
jgi:hypothetical protein